MISLPLNITRVTGFSGCKLVPSVCNIQIAIHSQGVGTDRVATRVGMFGLLSEKAPSKGML